jgi:hypothetical protein
MPGRKLFSVRNVASRLASTVARHPSSGMSSSAAGGVRLAVAEMRRRNAEPVIAFLRQLDESQADAFISSLSLLLTHLDA